MVDAAHQQKIRDPLHHGAALCPAVCAKLLAQSSALHARILVRQGCAQLTKHVVIKRRIGKPRAKAGIMNMMRHTRHDLMQHDINTCHILPFERTEIVPRADCCTRVTVVVLDNVTDIHHASLTAPVTKHAAEIIAVQRGDGVHICKTRHMCMLACKPQLAHIRQRVLAHLLAHQLDHARIVRQSHTHRAKRTLVAAGVNGMAGRHSVCKHGLIREKAHKRRTKVLGVVLVVRLVNRLQHDAAGLRTRHIDIVISVTSARIGIDIHAPKPLGHVKIRVALGQRGRQINIATRGLLALVGALEGVHTKDLVVRPRLADKEGGIGRGTHDVNVLLNDLALAQLGVFFLDQTVGVSRGIFLIV